MKPYLVTTEYRGVFYGYGDGEPKIENREIVLTNARNCLYWSEDCKGFLGLAAIGPTADCRIGPSVKSIRLFGVTSVTPVTAEAAKRWEEGP